MIELGTIQRRSGIHEALRYLNARTRYRFTELCRFEPPVLRGVHGFDRENAEMSFSGSIHALGGTYCSIARATGIALTTPDAPRDPRVERHDACNMMLSCLGVPIRRRTGELVGVVCHYDPRPRLAPVGEAEVLESIAPQLALWLTRSRDVAARALDWRSANGWSV